MAWILSHTTCSHIVSFLALHCGTRRAMHNKPYRVDATKICQVLPDFDYIPLEDSVRAAADSIVAMGLAAMKPTVNCCRAPQVREFEGALQQQQMIWTKAKHGCSSNSALGDQGSLLGRLSTVKLSECGALPDSPLGASGSDAICAATEH